MLDLDMRTARSAAAVFFSLGLFEAGDAVTQKMRARAILPRAEESEVPYAIRRLMLQKCRKTARSMLWRPRLPSSSRRLQAAADQAAMARFHASPKRRRT
jgi:hypothetical protein